MPRSGQALPASCRLKIGLFTDNDGNCVAFSGSANETHGGLVSNYEAIEVFTSWKDPERVADKQQQFTSLWGNTSPGLNCLDFTAFAAELLRPYLGARSLAKGRPPDQPPPRSPALNPSKGC